MGSFRCLLAAALGVGCGLAPPPSQLVMPTPPAPVPAAHRLRVAVLPFLDGRTEAPAPRGRYVYGGVEYRGTELRGDAMSQLTQAFAERLLTRGVFEEILLVRDRSQARSADLFLTGRVRRARGYVEASPDQDDSEEAKARGPLAWIVAEVDVQDLRLVDREGQVRFDGATGWALHRQTRGVEDPWAVLGEAWAQAADQVAGVWREAELQSARVPDQVGLAPGKLGFDALTERVPTGWSAYRDDARSPRGWSGDASCARLVLSQMHGLRFHRALGPYVPQARVWRCPPDVELEWDEGESYAAKLAGRSSDGRWLFVSVVGASNWSGAEEQLVEALAVEPPEQSYVFKIPLVQPARPRPSPRHRSPGPPTLRPAPIRRSPSRAQ